MFFTQRGMNWFLLILAIIAICIPSASWLNVLNLSLVCTPLGSIYFIFDLCHPFFYSIAPVIMLAIAGYLFASKKENTMIKNGSLTLFITLIVQLFVYAGLFLLTWNSMESEILDFAWLLLPLILKISSTIGLIVLIIGLTKPSEHQFV